MLSTKQRMMHQSELPPNTSLEPTRASRSVVSAAFAFAGGLEVR